MNLSYHTHNDSSVSDGFMNRLISFHAAQPKPELSDIWKGIEKTYYQPLIVALESKDPIALKAFLSNLYLGCTVFGMDWGHIAQTEYEAKYLERFAQAVRGLARNLGVLPEWNPDQPSPVNLSFEETIELTEKELGFCLTVKGCSHMPLAALDWRFFNAKLFEASHWLPIVKRASHSKPGSVLEIGSGLGFSMLSAYRSDIDCHSIDIPLVSVMGAWVLANEIGDDKIWLSGECFALGQMIFFHGITPDFEEEFDVVLNQDSLPEIPEKKAQDLVHVAYCALKTRGLFLSMNHESGLAGQNDVQKLMAGKFRTISRSPSWSRRGYVDQLFQKLPA